MPVERRERVIAIGIGSTGNGKNPIIDGRRQPSCGDTSRMNREVHVRFCEGLGVEFPGPTRPALPSAAPAGHGMDLCGEASSDPRLPRSFPITSSLTILALGLCTKRTRVVGNSPGQRAPMSETQRLSPAISSLL